MQAECCTADWRIFSTAVYSCHLLPSFATNKLWWLTYIRIFWSRDDQPTIRRKDFFGSWHSLLSHFLFFFPTNLSKWWRTSVYMHLYICTYLYVDRLYVIQLMPNITAIEMFLHFGCGANCFWIFITGVQEWWWWLGEYVALDRTCYIPCSKQLTEMSRWHINQWESPSQRAVVLSF